MYSKRLLACCMSALFISGCGGSDGGAPVATTPTVISQSPAVRLALSQPN